MTVRARNTQAFLDEIWQALDGDHTVRPNVSFTGTGELPSAFAVSDLAAAAIGAAALAVAELASTCGPLQQTMVDRRLASLWFSTSIRPEGWQLLPAWDALAGDYRCRDGWIRLHTNAPHHREAALKVLKAAGEKDAVVTAVRAWQGDALEAAIHAAGGCAAFMRSMQSWAALPQGSAVRSEPLVYRKGGLASISPAGRIDPARPLGGVRVLDLTRILAGPIATRFLAGFGAEVLRIDPIDWQEPSLEPEVTLGKRCARLDLKNDDDRERFSALLSKADIILHGYRPGALERLGFGEEVRSRIRPGLIDVCLDAYGWTGPWARRRGFDSLVQMRSGIAEAGMRHFDQGKPTPLPVQALDHAAGYILAAAAIRGLTKRRKSGTGHAFRASLARVAWLLLDHLPDPSASLKPIGTATDADFAAAIEQTHWGPARRLRPPTSLSTAKMRWDHPAGKLGASKASWRGRTA